MTTIHSTDSLKSIREALCVAQTAIPHAYEHQPDYWPRFNVTIQRLINDIDRQRPIGFDGKHGNLHTESCGCDGSESGF